MSPIVLKIFNLWYTILGYFLFTNINPTVSNSLSCSAVRIDFIFVVFWWFEVKYSQHDYNTHNCKVNHNVYNFMYLLNDSHPDVFMEAYFKSPFAPVFFMVYMFVTFYYFNNVVSCCPLIWLLIYWSETKTSYLPCYSLNLKEQRRRNTESFIYINGIIMDVLLFWNLL